jgi:hypothetical protein
VKTAFVTALAALLAVTALAAPVSAATPTERRLARQVQALQKQVKTLQLQMRTTRPSALLSVASGAIIYSACATAATADAFQATWEAIDRHAAHNAHGVDLFPPQTPLADPLNSCQRIDVQRQPNPAATPTTNVFAGLLNIFR